MRSFIFFVLLLVAVASMVQGGANVNWDSEPYETSSDNRINNIVNKFIDFLGFTIIEGGKYLGLDSGIDLKDLRNFITFALIAIIAFPLLKWLTIIGIWINEYRLRRRGD